MQREERFDSYALFWADDAPGGPSLRAASKPNGFRQTIIAGAPLTALDSALREAPSWVEVHHVTANEEASSSADAYFGDVNYEGCILPARMAPPVANTALVVIAVEVRDWEEFSQYGANLSSVVEGYGGSLLGASPSPAVIGRSSPLHIAALMSWPDRSIAADFYESDHYRPHRNRRRACSDGLILLID